MRTNIIKRCLFALLLLMAGGDAFAEDVTWVAAEQGYTNGTAYTSVIVNSNISLAFGDGSSGTYYTTGEGIRVYSDGYMKVSASTAYVITNIAITYHTTSYTGTFSVDTGTYSLSNTTGTWIGSASSVKFTNIASSGHARIQKLVITYTNSLTGKTPTTTTFPCSTYSVKIGESFTSPIATVTGGDNLKLSYTSDTESVATINSETGELTIVGPGTSIITATYAGNDTYEPSSASYTLFVSETSSGEEYYAVVSSYLGKYYAMGNILSNNILNGVEVYLLNNKVINVSDANAISWRLTDDGKVQNANGKQISYSSADISLSDNSSSVFTVKSDDAGNYWTSSTRSLIYRGNADGFKCYLTSNAGKSGYGTVGYLMNIADGYIRKVNIDESIGYKWGTICLPYSVKADDISGASVYSIVKADFNSENTPTSITLAEETGDLTAGQPYFIKSTDNFIVAYSGTAVNTAGSHNGLVGSFTEIDVPNGCYIVSDNELKTNGDGFQNYISANRAYIDFSKIVDSTSNVSQAKTIVLTLNDSETNSITDIKVNDSINNLIFNISGQRINAPAHGQTYIQGGHKFIAK